jgi:nucleotidyltransferase substrate binding protein (TIGR01987 family)
MPNPANPDVRWRQRFQNFQKALSQLADAVSLAQQRPLTDLEQQGLIKAFEFTHELAWNTFKDFLESRGASNLFGSKDATRAAFAAGLISDGEIWMQMIQSRNQTSHTYEQKTAGEIAGAVITRYLAEFEKMRTKFRDMERQP